MVCVLDNLQGYLTTPPGTGVIVLHGPGSIYYGRGTSGPQCCSPMNVNSRWAEMMATSDVGSARESAIHQPLYSPDEPLVVVEVLQCGPVCLVSTELHFVNGTVTSPYYLNNIINPVIVPLHDQHRANFIFMDDNAPAHRGCIIREQLLETGEPQMEWPTISPDLNPTENLWDQLSRRVEACNSVPHNHNDLRAALQEEWDAMPQLTIT